MYLVPVPVKRHQSRRAFAVSSGPLSQRTKARMPAALGDDLVQGGDGGIRVDRVVDEVGEGFAGELVNDVHLGDLRPPTARALYA